MAFKCIWLPLWKLRFSRHNTFTCRGILIDCAIEISGCGNVVEIQQGVRLENVQILIKGKNHKLIIGKGTKWFEHGRIRIEDEDNEIRIGENCDFRGCFFSCSDRNTSINIGDDCLFSSEVIVRTSDSHSIVDENSRRINPGKNVNIDDHVWIGYGATILKGAVIKRNSVVGTQTLLSSPCAEEGAIIAGNPGRVVRNGINWTKERL